MTLFHNLYFKLTCSITEKLCCGNGQERGNVLILESGGQSLPNRRAHRSKGMY